MKRDEFSYSANSSIFKSRIKKILILFLVIIVPILFNTGCGSCGTDEKNSSTTDTQTEKYEIEITGTVPQEYINEIVQRSDIASLVEADSLILRTDYLEANIVSPVPTPTNEIIKFEESTLDEGAVAFVATATSISGEQYFGLLEAVTDGNYKFSIIVKEDAEANDEADDEVDAEFYISFNVLIKSFDSTSDYMKNVFQFKNEDDTSSFKGVPLEVSALNKILSVNKKNLTVDMGGLSCKTNFCEPIKQDLKDVLSNRSVLKVS